MESSKLQVEAPLEWDSEHFVEDACQDCRNLGGDFMESISKSQ